MITDNKPDGLPVEPEEGDAAAKPAATAPKWKQQRAISGLGQLLHSLRESEGQVSCFSFLYH